MRTIHWSLTTLALSLMTTHVGAQQFSDPGCPAVEEWLSTLSTAPGGGAAAEERAALVLQAFTDERTEPVFGVGYSQWDRAQAETAARILARCQTEAHRRRDRDATHRVGQAGARIQTRLREWQAGGGRNPAPRIRASAKIEQPDCDSLQSWASVLMTQAERQDALSQGLSNAEMSEDRRARLLSDAEIEPRFGYPISEWSYSDFLYAGDPISRCSFEARAAGDSDASYQLRSAHGIIRQLGNEAR